LEIRGLGIVQVPWVENIALCLVVDLKPQHAIDRMPELGEMQTSILDVLLPRFMIDAAQPSAAARIRSFPFHLHVKSANELPLK
jgi:HPr kinase/phosphorylase